MRNIDRIDDTLDLIREIWYTYPDLRLCQLLENIKPNNLKDMYYIEDDTLCKLLERYYRKEK